LTFTYEGHLLSESFTPGDIALLTGANAGTKVEGRTAPKA
jgi:hypothetical protein